MIISIGGINKPKCAQVRFHVELESNGKKIENHTMLWMKDRRITKRLMKILRDEYDQIDDTVTFSKMIVTLNKRISSRNDVQAMLSDFTLNITSKYFTFWDETRSKLTGSKRLFKVMTKSDMYITFYLPVVEYSEFESVEFCLKFRVKIDNSKMRQAVSDRLGSIFRSQSCKKNQIKRIFKNSEKSIESLSHYFPLVSTTQFSLITQRPS